MANFICPANYLSILILSIVTFTVSSQNPCAGVTLRFVPNKRGCEWFFVCINEQLVQESHCAEGLHFDPAKQSCRFPSEVQCKLDKKDECSWLGVRLMPHPYSCRKYIKCDFGIESEHFCEDDLHFSIFERKCVPQQQAGCQIEQNLCPEIDDPFNVTFIPSSRDCEKYYMCMQSNIVPMRCRPGQFYDPKMNWCDDPENVDCVPFTPPLPNITSITCPNDGRLSFHHHPQTCQHYFICVNGASTMFTCPPGLFYDIIKERCDLISQAKCFHDLFPSAASIFKHFMKKKYLLKF